MIHRSVPTTYRPDAMHQRPRRPRAGRTVGKSAARPRVRQPSRLRSPDSRRGGRSPRVATRKSVRRECRSQERKSAGSRKYACDVALGRFRRPGRAKDTEVSIGDPRLDGWETVGTFEERATALAWRDRLRELGVDASCVADRPLDRFGRGDIYLVVPPDQWSRANEIVENLDN
jgi:hypothetical protein